jgi:hypothetical protein
MTNKLKLQHFINHIAFVLDRSGSMAGKIDTLETVFDNEIQFLKQRSVDLDQETRISIYTFDDRVECLVFDMDVMRVPSMRNQINSGGQTALTDATHKAIMDMYVLPQVYGDHAFLVYVLTDGQENASKISQSAFTETLRHLGNNWTLACMVPSARDVYEAKKFGFPQANVSVWSTTSSDGLKEVGKTTRSAMDSYMTARAAGVRSTKSFFSTDLSKVTKTNITRSLTELDQKQFDIFRVNGLVAGKMYQIKPFVESWTKEAYRLGSSYYELVKKEEIQGTKEIAVQNKLNGRVYTGRQARDVLGLPDYNLKVQPGDHGDWRIFVQSTSINRNLPVDSLVLVMK